jgi:hypothetical protein
MNGKNFRFCCILLGVVGKMLACTPPKSPHENRVEMLQGTWHTPTKQLYHTLYIQDSVHIGLDTHIDTVFFYEYKLVGDSLAIYKPHGELVNYNRILQLTSDTLVFEQLLDRHTVIGYSKRRF